LEFQKQQKNKESDGDCVDQRPEELPMFLPKVLRKITATLTQDKSCLAEAALLFFTGKY